MLDSIFKCYDIRGIVGNDFLLDSVYDFGCAFIYYCKQQRPKLDTIVIGRDGRVHSEQIYKELVRACTDRGITICSIGVCCTPVMYFALHDKLGQAGIMITASHNGPEYNGLKLCLGTKSVWGDQLQEIKKIMRAHSLDIILENTKKPGTILKSLVCQVNITEKYCEYLLEQFEHLKNLSIPLVIDCANGAAGTVIPQLVERMGWINAIILHQEIDGSFPNHGADPTVPENMRCVERKLAELENNTGMNGIGIGLDGDCDRMAALYLNSGSLVLSNLVLGDTLLALFVLNSPELEKISKKITVICDIKCSQAVLDLFVKNNIDTIVSPSGHSIIKQKIRDHNALFAGELSCHFFFSDRYFGYDDGIYAMLRLIELVHNSQKSFAQLCAEIPQLYTTLEMRIACVQEQKNMLIQAVHESFVKNYEHDECEIVTIDGVRVKTPYGTGLIRASHTQPVISLCFESETQDGLSRIQQEFYDILVLFLDVQVLHKYFCNCSRETLRDAPAALSG